MCGEPSPMVSWRVGRGIIESPMEWTSKCILYFHSSVEFNESYSDVVVRLINIIEYIKIIKIVIN